MVYSVAKVRTFLETVIIKMKTAGKKPAVFILNVFCNHAHMLQSCHLEGNQRL